MKLEERVAVSIVFSVSSLLPFYKMYEELQNKYQKMD